MINKVYQLLKSVGIPVDHIFRPDINEKDNMVLSYHFFDESGLICGDGKITEFGGKLQVDLFSKHRVDYSNVKKQVKKVLLDNGFILDDIDTSGEKVEGIGNIDHVIFIFSYIEKED